MFRNKCLVCKNDKIDEIINLGSHPFADTFITESKLSQADKVYPLIVDFCPDCYCIQLRTQTDPSERYEENEYSYTSSNSKVARTHWTEYASDVSFKAHLFRAADILEIGSNDGFLLKQFSDLGYSTLGFDASKAMCDLAAQNGQKTVHGLFTLENASKCADLKPSYHLIVANNVLNHSDDPLDFVLGVCSLLSYYGTFVFELPYWISGIENNKFDQIYHEHVTYWTVTHAVKFFELIGMFVNHVDLVDYHGGSIRLYVRHVPSPDSSVTFFIEHEKQYLDPEFYKTWMQKIRQTKNTNLANIYQKLDNGEKFVAVGAAAKGNTFLNYYNLDASVIECVTDASPHKIGKYTPRTRIPIVADSAIAGMGKVNAIMLSWNISQTIKDILLGINKDIHFFEV